MSTVSAQPTKEPQYNHQVRIRDEQGLATLGLSVNQAWHDDPRHVLFTLARYKFVAKMLSGKRRVLEVGCGDAFGTRLVKQEVASITAVDFDPVFVQDVVDRMDDRWPIDCRVHDMLAGPMLAGQTLAGSGAGTFDAAYSLDVIEHIPQSDEHRFLGNIAASLVEQGVLLIGTPSIYSQAYASPLSKEGHINCKTAQELAGTLREHFHNVFLFSMNDELVHTGYEKLAHYYFALAVGRR
jgi:2-polyprenyl-3-methyl-5-hydroxy-6-metoxy-1,4-benzoquinol methylase